MNDKEAHNEAKPSKPSSMWGFRVSFLQTRKGTDSKILLWHSNDHNQSHGAIHIHSSARPVYLTGALTKSLEQSRAKLSPIELYQSVIEKGFSKPGQHFYQRSAPTCYCRL